MKKLANLLVKGRIVFFIITIVATAFCGYLFFQQTPNKDMTKYLSDSSNMKQGLAVMDSEFAPAEEKSSIRVMFKNLDANQINYVKDMLLNIPEVNSVTYDANSSLYNKDDYTLFIINSKYEYDSAEYLNIESQLATTFKNYKFSFANNDIQSTTVPIELIMIALVLAVIILLIMSESWFEPLLFLISVGFAVIINMGSNSILPYTAEMTSSIGPVIQLVLSMDYSIILLNRYRIERANTNDKREAMKNSLCGAGGSIISSSLTTVVGLLALLFLSFKLGPELAIVLAKGVFISMICTFTVMPTLIIAFDKTLEKSKKPYPKMPVGGISKFAFKSKRVMPFLFAIAFIGFAVLQSFTQITFTEGLSDPVADVFTKNNTVVLLYDNEDEPLVDDLIAQIQTHEKVDDVLGYTTTLGKKYTSSEMVGVISAMGADFNLDKSVIDLLYFTHGKNELPKITLENLFNFISNDLVSNPLFSDYLDADLIDSINQIKSLFNVKTLTTPTTATQIANTFAIDKQMVELVFIYEKALQTEFIPNGMEFNKFANFLKNSVITNPLFADFIAPDMTEQIDLFLQISDKQTLKTEMNSDQLSAIFGMDKQSIQAVFLLSGKLRMTIPDFVNSLLTNESISSMIDGEQKSQLETLDKIMHLVLGDAIIPHYQMAEIANVSESDMKLLFTLYQANSDTSAEWTLSPQLFVSTIANDLLPNPLFNESFDEQTAYLITALNGIIEQMIAEKQYDSTEFYQLINDLLTNFNNTSEGVDIAITQVLVDTLFTLYGSTHNLDSAYTVTLIDFLTYLSDDFINDDRFKNFFTDDVKQTLVQSKSQMTDAVSQMKGKNYSRLVLNTRFAEESAETQKFINLINDYRNANFSKNSYLIGNSAMVSEMQSSFQKEYLLISLITSIAIFLVVLLTFKNALIPLILTLLVQCGVFITVSVIGVTGGCAYYLALLIVQSILMGATIDYGIVFCNNYKECRKTLSLKDSLKKAYENSTHTVLTSGSILVLVILIIGLLTSSAMINQVCITLSIGAFVAILLILLTLPALCCGLDKFIIKNGFNNENDNANLK